MVESSLTGKENTAGKGEIAHYEQFLLFLQCFQKACTANTKKPGLVWERVKSCEHFLEESELKSFADDKKLPLILKMKSTIRGKKEMTM